MNGSSWTGKPVSWTGQPRDKASMITTHPHISFAQQVHQWDSNLRKTSAEKLKARTVQMDRRDQLAEARALALQAKPPRSRSQTPPPRRVRDLLQRSLERQNKARNEVNDRDTMIISRPDLSTRIPRMYDLPRNATVRRAEQLASEIINPFSLYDMISNDRQQHFIMKQREHLIKMKSRYLHHKKTMPTP